MPAAVSKINAQRPITIIRRVSSFTKGPALILNAMWIPDRRVTRLASVLSRIRQVAQNTAPAAGSSEHQESYQVTQTYGGIHSLQDQDVTKIGNDDLGFWVSVPALYSIWMQRSFWLYQFDDDSTIIGNQRKEE